MRCNAKRPTLRDHSYLATPNCGPLGGVGELYDSLLVYENFPPGGLVGGGEFTANGATFRPAALESLSHFPVTIAAHMVDDQLTVLVEVIDGALGCNESRDRWAERLLDDRAATDCRSGTARCATSASCSTAKRTRDRDAARDSHADRRRCAHQRSPRSPYSRLASRALSWAGGELTYRELDEAADRLAAALAAAGCRAEDPGARSTFRRGPDYVIAMLGVLKAGGVIVPLDPAMPADRIADILGQMRRAAVIVDDALLATVAAEPYDTFGPVAVRPGQAAYVVFTSGTTGRPKGVIGTHQALLAYAEDHALHVLRPGGRPG